ncbi:class I SAM-dependent methyltransferase [Kocuria sabuli]|uniref:class I SAM-dependent methyltransferase n=1 Tax=Kocuria sabuli TaxID=3071448 RepID=UPI0034D427F9
MPDEYAAFAPFYDLLSAEHPVYRAGRRAGAAALAPRPGDQVLDVGCGTGLNFALLQEVVGSTGRIVGIDRSPRMLDRARRRVRRRGWRNVILLEADATTLSAEGIGARIASAGGRERSDAALATYALSLMPDWEGAWQRMLALCAPAASLAVVDLQEPTGAFSVLRPLARLSCRLGGSDVHAHPWHALERDCTDVVATSARGGHLQIRAGRRRPEPPA